MTANVRSLDMSVGNFSLLKVECKTHFADDFTSWKVKVLKIMKKVTCHHGSHHCKRWMLSSQTFTLGSLTSWCWERTGAGGPNNDIFIVKPHYFFIVKPLRKIKGITCS